MEALGQLAGGIAHDFNNVLQAVAGGLSLILRRATEPEEVRKLANMAIGASDRGAAITGRLLSFARRGELQPSTIAPRPLLEGLREILVPTLGSGIAINLEVADDAPLLVADKAQLETVLINLAVNARDAMPAGGELTIRAVADTAHKGEGRSAGLRPGSYLRLEVRDDGAGMDLATLKRASEPFFTTKPSGQGTGLGLAMARGFAEQSGGAFSISSEIGLGTTVTLWFPEADEAGTGLPAKAEPAPRALHGRALVVDDDPMVREILTRQLQAVGFQTIAASDGLDALSKIDAGLVVEVLVTDYSMPGMKGTALIEEARRRQPRLPAVLLTGFADGAMRAKFEEENGESSITTLLRKPVDEDELADRLAAVLLSSPEGAS
jgi:CheY-like chemotaxis protein/two-component sensor histidine kinase